MTKEQERIRQNLVKIVSYFEMVAQDCNWLLRRKIEYDIALATANLISAKNCFSKKDFLEIASCINQIVGQEHANGSGWYDFQIRISGFFRSFDYASDWNSVIGEFIFWEDEINLWSWLKQKILWFL
jgi:hypothetical protein